MEIAELFTLAIQNKASDLHLSAGLAPMIRIDGQLSPVNIPILCTEQIQLFLQTLMNRQQIKEFERHLEIDFVFEIPTRARFRVNAFMQSRGPAVAFRIIPMQIPTMEDLHLPPIFKDISACKRGLVLVTGSTGSGKSTTLAAIINYINSSRYEHILTVEDPIEFVHSSKNCLINQREIHKDTLSFNSALRSALREDPDIILVGELRDLETIRLALIAAETGHLVLATVHTNSAVHTINRLIEVFPAEEQALVRSMLSESLQAVIAQRLVKKINGGRIAALELMLGTVAIRNLIRENKTAQMYSAIQIGQSKGMQTLDQHLSQLVSQNCISKQVANEAAVNKAMF